MKKILSNSIGIFITLTLLGHMIVPVNAGLFTPTDQFGKVDVGITKYNDDSNGATPFINRLINFSAAIATVWLLVTIIINGAKIIGNDKGPEVLATSTKNIMLSILGLGIAALSYVFTSYMGETLFGSGSYFTDPVSSMNKVSSGYSDALPMKWIFDKLPDVPTTSSSVFGSIKPVTTTMTDQTSKTAPGYLMTDTIAFIAAAASIWLLISIIWNGIKIITSDKPDAVSTAIKNITYSIIGFMIAMLAYVITSFVSNAFFNDATIIENPASQLTTNGIPV